MRTAITILFAAAVMGVAASYSSDSLDFSREIFQPLSHYKSSLAYEPEEKWAKLANPAQAGWSTEKIEQVVEHAKQIHSDALVVVYNGVVVLAHGDPTQRYRLRSVRKSLMNVAYGVFVGKGRIDIHKTLLELDINDKSPLTDKERRATVRDLLMSKSGVYHPAAYETRGMRERRPQRGSHGPGEFWFYNNWDFNTLVTIFGRATGQDFFRAFEQEVAKPLRMQHFRLRDTEYRYEKDKSVHPAYLFRMSALDLSRVGLLYMRHGQFDGKQIVPREWIDESTYAQHKWDRTRSTGYGYLWNIFEDGYYAAGVGGQRLFVAPDYDLIVVHQVDTRGGKRVSSRKIWDLYKKIRAAMPKEHTDTVRE